MIIFLDMLKGLAWIVMILSPLTWFAAPLVFGGALAALVVLWILSIVVESYHLAVKPNERHEFKSLIASFRDVKRLLSSKKNSDEAGK